MESNATRGTRRLASVPEVTADCPPQQTTGTRHAQQALAGFLQGSEVRYGPEIHQGAKLRHVVQDADDAPVVGLEERLQHQAREELGLSIKMRAEAMRKGWQSLLSHAKCFTGDA